MNISKALKTKNRMARAIKDQMSDCLRNEIQQFQSKEEAVTSATEQESLHKDQVIELQDALRELSLHKAAIAQANQEAWFSIFMMGELKSMQANVQMSILGAPETNIREQVSSNKETKTIYNTSRQSKTQLKALCATLQEQIDEYQDNLDEYNAMTQI